MKLNESSSVSPLCFADLVSQQTKKRYGHLNSKRKTIWIGKVSSSWDNPLNWTNGIPKESMFCMIPPIPEECFSPKIEMDISINFSLFNQGYLINEGLLTIKSKWAFENNGYFENSEIGIVTNCGSISNKGSLKNLGSLDNLNVFINLGLFYNIAHLNNEQIWSNIGTLNNVGFIDNQSIFNNMGIFENTGTLQEHDESIFNEIKKD